MSLPARSNRLLGSFLVVLAVIGMIAWGCSRTPPPTEGSRTVGTAIRDASITASVKLALVFEPGVAATEINVDTDRGVVTLRGEVGTEAERRLAVKVAEDVAQVGEVVNDLTIRG